MNCKTFVLAQTFQTNQFGGGRSNDWIYNNNLHTGGDLDELPDCAKPLMQNGQQVTDDNGSTVYDFRPCVEGKDFQDHSIIYKVKAQGEVPESYQANDNQDSDLEDNQIDDIESGRLKYKNANIRNKIIIRKTIKKFQTRNTMN